MVKRISCFARLLSQARRVKQSGTTQQPTRLYGFKRTCKRLSLSLVSLCLRYDHQTRPRQRMYNRRRYYRCSGADPGFFLGGGALVSCSTSTPVNHIVFFSQNTSCIRKPQVISGEGGGVRTPCTLPLDPPLLLFLINKADEFVAALRNQFICVHFYQKFITPYEFLLLFNPITRNRRACTCADRSCLRRR